MKEQTKETVSDWTGVAYGVSLGVLASFQQFKLSPVLPLLIESYGYGKLLAGSFMSVYALAGLLLSVYIGLSMARRGPSQLLVLSIVLMLAGNLLTLAMPASGHFVLMSRLLEGVGFAVLAVIGGVIATTSANARHRPIAIALWATWLPMGQILSSLISIPLVGDGNWRPLWWVSIGATILMALWGWSLKSGGHLPVQSSGSGPKTADGADSTIKSHPSVSIDGARRTTLMFSSMLFSLWAMQYLAFSSWLPQYLVEVRGLTHATAALVYLFPPVLIVIFCVISGLLIRAWGLKFLLPFSIVVQAMVWFSVPKLGVGISGVIALAAYGVTVGITPTCLFALPNAILGGGLVASHGFAAIMTGRNLGAFLGPILLAQALKMTGGWDNTMWLFGFVCVVSALLGAHITRRIARLHSGCGTGTSAKTD